MAIKGSLREASLPDVLQLLAMGQKTGCLSVADRNNFGYIYFDRGRISYASIVNRRDRLGDLLVKHGVITQLELDVAVEAQSRGQRGKRIGEILIEQHILTREELHRYIRVQIEEAVYYLFTWTQGTFSFEADMRPEDHDVLVSINPESLLLEGARRVDEWSLIEKKVPTFDLIFEVDRARLAQSEAQLTPAQEQLIPLIDGRRDVTTLIDASGIGEFEVGKALYALATAGYLHRVGKSRPVDDGVREARVEEHRNLGVAFYKTAMFEEATREFRRVVELNELDVPARFFLGLVAMREGKWSEAVLTLREAAAQPDARPAIFHNLAYALERMGHYDDAREALQEAIQRGGQEDPRTRTSLGVLALKSGEVDEADALLTGARLLWGKRAPSPAWFHYAALAAALAGRRTARSRSCSRASSRIRTRPCSTTRSPPCTSGAVTCRPRGRRRSAACTRTAPSRSSSRTSATVSIAPRATTKRWKRSSGRSSSIPRSATTSTSSSATSASSGRRRTKPSRTGSARSR